jgi:hypothetical protein
LSQKLLEQGFGVFQIGSVKPLRKSPVDIAKRRPSVVTPTPTCENAGEARRRSHLERPCTLAPGDVESSPEAGLGFFAGLRASQAQLAFKTIQLSLMVPLAGAIYDSQRLTERREAL